MNERIPMGKEFKCHLGEFVLPVEIYEVMLDEDSITFWCSDGIYQAMRVEDWIINKIEDLDL